MGGSGGFAGDCFAPALPCSSLFGFASLSPALPRPALNPAGCSCVMENPAVSLDACVTLGVFPPRRQDSQFPGLHGDSLSLTFCARKALRSCSLLSRRKASPALPALHDVVAFLWTRSASATARDWKGSAGAQPLGGWRVFLVSFSSSTFPGSFSELSDFHVHFFSFRSLPARSLLMCRRRVVPSFSRWDGCWMGMGKVGMSY